jgi:site-specific recombinase XerD
LPPDREASSARPDLKDQRDRALLLLTFACAMRRAEAAALDVADLRRCQICLNLSGCRS